jgi:hypothetical protein
MRICNSMHANTTRVRDVASVCKKGQLTILPYPITTILVLTAKHQCIPSTTNMLQKLSKCQVSMLRNCLLRPCEAYLSDYSGLVTPCEALQVGNLETQRNKLLERICRGHTKALLSLLKLLNVHSDCGAH